MRFIRKAKKDTKTVLIKLFEGITGREYTDNDLVAKEIIDTAMKNLPATIYASPLKELGMNMQKENEKEQEKHKDLQQDTSNRGYHRTLKEEKIKNIQSFINQKQQEKEGEFNPYTGSNEPQTISLKTLSGENTLFLDSIYLTINYVFTTYDFGDKFSASTLSKDINYYLEVWKNDRPIFFLLSEAEADFVLNHLKKENISDMTIYLKDIKGKSRVSTINRDISENDTKESLLGLVKIKLLAGNIYFPKKELALIKELLEKYSKIQLKKFEEFLSKVRTSLEKLDKYEGSDLQALFQELVTSS